MSASSSRGKNVDARHGLTGIGLFGDQPVAPGRARELRCGGKHPAVFRQEIEKIEVEPAAMLFQKG